MCCINQALEFDFINGHFDVPANFGPPSIVLNPVPVIDVGDKRETVFPPKHRLLFRIDPLPLECLPEHARAFWLR